MVLGRRYLAGRKIGREKGKSGEGERRERKLQEMRERKDDDERETRKKIFQHTFSLPVCPKHQLVKFGLFPSKYFSFTKFSRVKKN